MLRAIRLLFSSTGRISRSTFWLANLSVCLALSPAIALVAVGPTFQILRPDRGGEKPEWVGLVAIAFLAAIAVWVAVCLAIKRWHDLNRTGWLVLLQFIPYLGALIGFVFLGCVRGTDGPNRYGDNPAKKLTGGKIGLIIGLVLVPVFIAVAANVVRSGRIMQEADVSVAYHFVNDTMRTALATYRITMGDYPSTEEGLRSLLIAPAGKEDRWQGPYINLKEIPLDPWGHPYRYRFPAVHHDNNYDLWSSGPDGIDGTLDDIVNSF